MCGGWARSAEGFYCLGTASFLRKIPEPAVEYIGREYRNVPAVIRRGLAGWPGIRRLGQVTKTIKSAALRQHRLSRGQGCGRWPPTTRSARQSQTQSAHHSCCGWWGRTRKGPRQMLSISFTQDEADVEDGQPLLLDCFALHGQVLSARYTDLQGSCQGAVLHQSLCFLTFPTSRLQPADSQATALGPQMAGLDLALIAAVGLLQRPSCSLFSSPSLVVIFSASLEAGSGRNAQYSAAL